jgi:hypothetical protein
LKRCDVVSPIRKIAKSQANALSALDDRWLPAKKDRLHRARDEDSRRRGN